MFDSEGYRPIFTPLRCVKIGTVPGEGGGPRDLIVGRRSWAARGRIGQYRGVKGAFLGEPMIVCASWAALGCIGQYRLGLGVVGEDALR